MPWYVVSLVLRFIKTSTITLLKVQIYAIDVPRVAHWSLERLAIFFFLVPPMMKLLIMAKKGARHFTK